MQRSLDTNYPHVKSAANLNRGEDETRANETPAGMKSFPLTMAITLTADDGGRWKRWHRRSPAATQQDLGSLGQ